MHRINILWFFLLASTSPAIAGQYTYTRVFVAPNSTQIVPGGLNALGTAAFSLPEVGVYSGNGGPLTTIADASRTQTVFSGGEDNYPFTRNFTNFKSPSITNDGTVYFHTEAVMGGVYKGDGSAPFVAVYEDFGYPDPYLTARSVVANNNGMVGFSGPGLQRVVGDNRSIISPTLDLFDHIGMNDLGAIAAYSYYNETLTLFEGTSATTIATNMDAGPNYPFLNIYNPVAVSNSGKVVFAFETQYATVDGPGYFYGDSLVMSYQGSRTILLDYTDGVAGIGPLAMNNSDHIAITGYRPNGAGVGVYTLIDGTLTSIIGTGDALDGSTVTTISLSPRGLNDSGQMLVLATLADGRTGLYIANPVPEPGTFALASIGLFTYAGFAMRRRFSATTFSRYTSG